MGTVWVCPGEGFLVWDGVGVVGGVLCMSVEQAEVSENSLSLHRARRRVALSPEQINSYCEKKELTRLNTMRLGARQYLFCFGSYRHNTI